MDGRAPCGFLLSFGEGGGIIGDVGEMWEREREHHGVGEIAPLNYAFNDRLGRMGYTGG